MDSGQPTRGGMVEDEWPSLGVVGLGTIAMAVIQGLMELEEPPPRVVLCPRNAEKAAWLAQKYPDSCVVASSNQEVLDSVDVVLIGLRTQVYEEILKGLKFRNQSQKIVTMTSCVSVETMASVVNLPVENVGKAVPLPAVAIHKGVTIITGAPKVTHKIFSELGGTQPCANEAELTSLMVMTCQMGPFYKFLETCGQFMVSRGVPSNVASQYTAKCMQTIVSDAVDKWPGGVKAFTGLVEEQTPGGLNEVNISDLSRAGVFEEYEKSLQKTVDILTGNVSLKKDDDATSGETGKK